MALTSKQIKALKVAMPQKRAGVIDGKKVADVLDASAARSAEAEALVALGAPVAVTGVDGTGSNAASKADVDSRLTAIHSKIDAIIASLKA